MTTKKKRSRRRRHQFLDHPLVPNKIADLLDRVDINNVCSTVLFLVASYRIMVAYAELRVMNDDVQVAEDYEVVRSKYHDLIKINPKQARPLDKLRAAVKLSKGARDISAVTAPVLFADNFPEEMYFLKEMSRSPWSYLAMTDPHYDVTLSRLLAQRGSDSVKVDAAEVREATLLRAEAESSDVGLGEWRMRLVGLEDRFLNLPGSVKKLQAFLLLAEATLFAMLWTGLLFRGPLMAGELIVALAPVINAVAAFVYLVALGGGVRVLFRVILSTAALDWYGSVFERRGNLSYGDSDDRAGDDNTLQLVVGALVGLVVKKCIKVERINYDNGNWFEACKKGDTATVKGLLARPSFKGANARDGKAAGDTGLTLACKKNREATVKVILELGEEKKVNPNLPNLAGDTALAIAAERGHGQVLSRLLKCKKVDLGGNQGLQAMRKAVEHDRYKMASDVLARMEQRSIQVDGRASGNLKRCASLQNELTEKQRIEESVRRQGPIMIGSLLRSLQGLTQELEEQLSQYKTLLLQDILSDEQQSRTDGAADGATMEDLAEMTVCPICCDDMAGRRIFACSNDHWTCEACVRGAHCFTCREDFGLTPPTRRHTVERMVAIISQLKKQDEQ